MQSSSAELHLLGGGGEGKERLSRGDDILSVSGGSKDLSAKDREESTIKNYISIRRQKTIFHKFFFLFTTVYTAGKKTIEYEYDESFVKSEKNTRNVVVIFFFF